MRNCGIEKMLRVSIIIAIALLLSPAISARCSYELSDEFRGDKEAQESFEKYDDTKNPFYYIREAIKYHDMKNAEEVIKNATTAIELAPDNMGVVYYAASLYSYNGKREEANNMINKALTINKPMGYGLYRLLQLQEWILDRLGRKEESKEVYKSYLENHPDYVDAYLAYSQSISKIIYLYDAEPITSDIALNAANKAIDVLNNALDAGLEDQRIYSSKAFLLKKIGKYRDALVAYKKAGVTGIQLGDLFFEMERYEDAIECYDSDIENPDNDLWRSMLLERKGEALLKLRRIHDFLALIENNGDIINEFHAKDLYEKALNLLITEDRLEEALSVVNHSRDRVWADSELEYKYKLPILLELHRHDDALKAIDEFWQDDTAAIAVAKAIVLMDEGELEKGIEILDKEIMSNPGYSKPLAAKAYLLMNTGKYNEAVNVAIDAMRINDEGGKATMEWCGANHYFPYAPYSLSLALYKRNNEGDREEAIKIAQDSPYWQGANNARRLALSGEIKRMFEELRTCVEDDPVSRLWLKRALELEEYWYDPEFIAIVGSKGGASN